MQKSSLKIMRAEIFIIMSVAFITMLHFVDAGAYGPCLTGKCYVFFSYSDQTISGINSTNQNIMFLLSTDTEITETVTTTARTTVDTQTTVDTKTTDVTKETEEVIEILVV